ncbi:OsmC family protein [Acetobacter sp. AN02]|uniref:OsmC family protein n=1 Tax=Acetobacter sp. AN02 TaxID=2894186 RepID=UPI0024340F90|nr:OsmC family protein [Acetobacter sp. AN02]MDG6095445.1 OsmC family protein [Acetobacter sp. AN02]
MAIRKYGTAHWEGAIREGGGTISTESGALKNQPYGFNTRFEDKAGTNPEELIGAAHAGCFTMALSGALGKAGLTATSLDTKATVTLEKQGEGFAVTAIHLALNGIVPGATEEKFREIATAAKQNCPISKLFTAEIKLEVSLSS